MRALALAAGLIAFAAGPALAGQPVTLRPSPVDADGVVTLGDLFDGAGAAEGVPVATRNGSVINLDAGVVQSSAARAGLDWANAQGIRRIVVVGGSLQAARGNVEVLTYARSLAAGEMVQPQDLVWSKAAAAPSDAPSDAEQVIGLAAKRPLRAGAAVSARDVSAPQVIKSGEMITVTWSDGQVSLTLQGKALGAAAPGQVLSVQNTASKKVLQAIATGPGQAAVGPEADQLKADRTMGRLAYNR